MFTCSDCDYASLVLQQVVHLVDCADVIGNKVDCIIGLLIARLSVIQQTRSKSIA